MTLRFHRYAGSLQPGIGSFEELKLAVALPQTLWVALACPVEGLSCDKKFLSLLDQDGNKRIRVSEVRAAVLWLEQQLCDYRGIDAASDQLPLSYLAPGATQLKAAAQMILTASGLALDAPLTLALVRKSEETLRAKQVTGDGVVAVAGFSDPALAQLVEEILSIFPGSLNRSQDVGISIAHLDQFQQQQQALLAHQARQAGLWVWGDGSLGLARQIQALRSQIDAYFMQCRLVAAQPDTLHALRLNIQKISDSLGDAAALSHWYGALPIAPLHPERHLKWAALLPGPSWEALKGLAGALGGEGISEQAWQQLTQQAEAILKWEADFQAIPLSKKPALCSVPETQVQRIRARCLVDLEMRDELAVIEELERLLLYQQLILVFSNNFISVPQLYNSKQQALFEKGHLVLAGREFRLSVLVQDRASHVKIAEHSSLCLAYVRVEDKQGAYEVVVPITAGTTAGVEVGRRGIFYDRDGVEYDATVMQVLLQPVSLWEAMTQPFTRIMAFIEQKVSEFAAIGDKKLDEGVSAVWNNVVQPTGSTVHLGMVAAGGVALAALSSSLVFVVAQLQQLTLLGFLQTLASMALLVMVPAGLLAALKLRRRNLAVILEGSGWALNDRLLLNAELGRLLTRRPRRPQNTLIATKDRVNEALQLRQKEFLDDNVDTAREGTLILVVLGLMLFLVVSSNWEILLQWAGAEITALPTETIPEVPSP